MPYERRQTICLPLTKSEILPSTDDYILEAKSCAQNCLSNLEFYEVEYAKMELKKAIAILKANIINSSLNRHSVSLIFVTCTRLHEFSILPKSLKFLSKMDISSIHQHCIFISFLSICHLILTWMFACNSSCVKQFLILQTLCYKMSMVRVLQLNTLMDLKTHCQELKSRWENLHRLV